MLTLMPFFLRSGMRSSCLCVCVCIISSAGAKEFPYIQIRLINHRSLSLSAHVSAHAKMNDILIPKAQHCV